MYSVEVELWSCNMLLSTFPNLIKKNSFTEQACWCLCWEKHLLFMENRHKAVKMCISSKPPEHDPIRESQWSAKKGLTNKCWTASISKTSPSSTSAPFSRIEANVFHQLLHTQSPSESFNLVINFLCCFRSTKCFSFLFPEPKSQPREHQPGLRWENKHSGVHWHRMGQAHPSHVPFSALLCNSPLPWQWLPLGRVWSNRGQSSRLQHPHNHRIPRLMMRASGKEERTHTVSHGGGSSSYINGSGQPKNSYYINPQPIKKHCVFNFGVSIMQQ